ncbi:GSCOCG00004710001-RA-CDS [Cotesia congregata]|nr:GSCOCG00004710001-RA-CDS [Cotesia congregata]
MLRLDGAKFMPESQPAQQAGPVYQYGPPPGVPVAQPGAAPAPAGGAPQTAPAAYVGSLNDGLFRRRIM